METLIHKADGTLESGIPWYLIEGTKVEVVSLGGSWSRDRYLGTQGIINRDAINHTQTLNRDAYEGYFYAYFEAYGQVLTLKSQVTVTGKSS